jgi:hypothetical protein
MGAPKKRTLPLVGSCYEKTYKGTKYRMVVVKHGSGIGYKVGNKVFKAPSEAARSVTGNDVNGWIWWRIDTTEA